MTLPRARRRLLLLAAAALALLFCFIFAPSRFRDSKPHFPPAADPSVRLDLAPAEIFRRAFWRQPTPADRIVHAERREWKDAADAVQRWQWFLQVEPGPALLAALRDPAVFGLAPVAAPLIGSTLMDVIGWRGTLGVLACIAIVMLAGSVFVIRETLPPEKRAVGRGLGLRELASRRYLAATATFACSFAVMMSYISASPFVYQEVMGLTTVGYGLMFGLNALGLVTSSTIASRLVVRLTPERVLGFGVVGIITSNIVLTTLIVSGVPAIWLSIPLFFSTSSLGFVSGPSTAIALGAVEKSKGLASAVIGATQFGLGGIAAPLVGLDGSANTLPMGITMLTLAVLATISCLVLRAGSRLTPAGRIPEDEAATPPAAPVPDSSAR